MRLWSTHEETTSTSQLPVIDFSPKGLELVSPGQRQALPEVQYSYSGRFSWANMSLPCPETRVKSKPSRVSIKAATKSSLIALPAAVRLRGLTQRQQQLLARRH